MTKTSKLVALASLLLCLASVSVEAAVVVYSGSDSADSTMPRPNSDAAAAAFSVAASSLGPTSLIDFEAAPVGSFNNYPVAPGVTMNGTSFASADQTILNSPFSPPDELFGYNTTSGGTQFALLNGGDLTFTFSPAVQSFGAYFSGIQLAIETITFSDGAPQSLFLPLPSPSNGGVAFIGFTDSGAAISSVTINVLGDLVAIDDVRFGLATAVPEPSALDLAAAAGAALVGIRLLAGKRRGGTPT